MPTTTLPINSDEESILIANIVIPKIYNVLRKRWEVRNENRITKKVLLWGDVNSSLGSAFSFRKKETKRIVRMIPFFYPDLKVSGVGIFFMGDEHE